MGIGVDFKLIEVGSGDAAVRKRVDAAVRAHRSLRPVDRAAAAEEEPVVLEYGNEVVRCNVFRLLVIGVNFQ